MKRDHSEGESVEGPSGDAPEARPDIGSPTTGGSRWNSLRFKIGAGALVALLFVFWKPFTALAFHAAHSEIHSHVLLVPFITAYLIRVRRQQLPQEVVSSPAWAVIPLLVGLLAFVMGAGARADGAHFSENDRLSLLAFSFYCFLIAGGFLFLGQKWMRACAFPVMFLIFMVPLPDGVVDSLETASKLASAEASAVFFRLSGTPVLRDGTIFQLPGMVVEVAQECSGIRSSLVLFITGLLASNLLLKSPWRRAVLIAVVIPLGIVRNGLRILVVSLLCVHVGPHMIHSDIHRRGGPVFFTLSLVPLFILLWWLRRGEVIQASPGSDDGVVRQERDGEDRKAFNA